MSFTSYPPTTGLFRVGRQPDPFAPPPFPAPLEASTFPVTSGNRWDAPDGNFRTLYWASSAEAALGETLAAFRTSPGVAERINAFLDGDADPDTDPTAISGEVPAEFFASRALARAQIHGDYPFFDVDDAELHVILTYDLADLLRTLGLREVDRGAVMSPDRRLTRPIAGALRRRSGRSDTTAYAGIRYESRLDRRWECWAHWEMFRVSRRLSNEPLTPTHPAVLSAAGRLGLTLQSA